MNEIRDALNARHVSRTWESIALDVGLSSSTLRNVASGKWQTMRAPTREKLRLAVAKWQNDGALLPDNGVKSTSDGLFAVTVVLLCSSVVYSTALDLQICGGKDTADVLQIPLGMVLSVEVGD